MVERDPRELEPPAPGLASVIVKFTIRRDGSDRTDAALEKSSGNPMLDLDALRAVLDDENAARCRRVHQSDADRASQFPIPTMNPYTSDPSVLPRSRSPLTRSPRAAAALGQQPPQPPRAAAAERNQRRRSAAARPARRRGSRCPISSRCPPDAETLDDREDDRPGALGRPELRARVRAHPARRLRARFPPATSFDDVAVRPLARAERRRRRSSAPCRRPAPASASRCGCSTSKTRQPAFGKEYERLGGEPALLRAHDLRRDPRAAAGAARRRPHASSTFDSDRDGERMTGTVENRGVKEIYIADYDGENQRRVTDRRDR